MVDCLVDDATRRSDGTFGLTRIPRCDDASGLPCRRVHARSECADNGADGLGLEIDRGDRPPRSNTAARALCRVASFSL